MSPLIPLIADDLAKTYGDRVVLTGIDIVANPGQPVGVVGENGVGKSTLLRLLAGIELSDSGLVSRPRELGYLSQDPALTGPATVRETLADALAPMHEAVRRLEQLAERLDDGGAGVAEAYSATLAWAEHHDAWDADRRAEVASLRLGLAEIAHDRAISSMSGGERTRLALAALVTRRPACVVLDEPTNHLDDAAMEYLEQFLLELPGVVVLASHDRILLDRVCSVVVDLDPSHFGVDGGGGTRFVGGFSAYLEHKRAARRRWEEAFLTQQDQLNELRTAARTTARHVAHNRGPRDGDKYIYHFKGGKVAATVRRRVHGVERRIEVIQRDQIPKPPRQLSFDSTALESKNRSAAVSLSAVEVRGRLSLARLEVVAGHNLLVTGSNGSGKSTLLGVLAGRVAVDSGTVDVGPVSVGLLPQDVRFSRPDLTPRQVYDMLVGRSPAAATPGLDELGLLQPRELGRPVGVLSIGQQRRLALAVLVAQHSDMLLLDEPTNHISLALASELEDALGRTAATVILATHDRWLRSRWLGPVLPLTGASSP